MWKWVRLTALIVVTIALAALTYPTWGDLIFPRPQTAPQWTEVDQLRFYSPQKAGIEVNACISASTYSTDDDGVATKNDPSATLGFRAQSTNTKNPAVDIPSFVYVETIGQADVLMRECMTSYDKPIERLLSKSDGEFRDLNGFSRSSSWDPDQPKPTPKPEPSHSYYKFDIREAVTCPVTNYLWAKDSNTWRFSTPQLSSGAGPNEFDGPNMQAVLGACTRVSVLHLGSENPGYQFPSGLANKTTGYNAVEWSLCYGRTDKPDSPRYQDATLSSTGLQLTNLDENNAVQTRLFFAGVSLGF